MGNKAESERSLQQYTAAHPEIGPQGIERLRDTNGLYAALVRKDAQGVLTEAGKFPNYVRPWLRYPRGWAHLQLKDYARAEEDLRIALSRERDLGNFNAIRTRTPLLAALAHFYLGQVYEATGKRDLAVNEHQEFLSHFENSRAQLPQIAEARAALERSMP